MREVVGFYLIDASPELVFVWLRIGAVQSQGSGRRAIPTEQTEELTFRAVPSAKERATTERESECCGLPRLDPRTIE